MVGRANFFWPPSNTAGPVVGAWVGSTTLVLPMTRVPPKFMLTGVPEMMTPFPPGRIEVPSIANPVGLAVMVCPATVTISAGVMTADESVCVLEPTTASAAPGARLIGVPRTVMMPPGVRVWDAMTKSDEASAVYVEPSNVKTGASAVEGLAEAVPRNWVLEPMTAKLVPWGMEMTVEEAVIVPPGVKV